jgi:SecD/SecF fusion protein
VLTRSLATTACTLMPIAALLLFGGVSGSSELQDFAFALLIGVASGAYSSIFIASPVLTHWKEREAVYRSRRRRIEAENGFVPAYAGAGADVEPTAKRGRRPGRITTPPPETVSAAEFDQMKRDLDVERAAPARQTSTLTKPPARTKDEAAPAPAPAPAPARHTPQPKPQGDGAPRPAGDGAPRPAGDGAPRPAGDGAEHAPDIPENEGVAPVQKPKRPAKSRSRNRRHGRRR